MKPDESKPQQARKHQPVLVLGATGYVGGRLVPKLLEAGYKVRALARSRQKLLSRSWAQNPGLEPAVGDMLDLPSLKKAAHGCRAAFYLVHSMNPAVRDFAQADRQAARNMVEAASQAGMEQIIYLGGLLPQGQRLSHHLKSRAEVGDILRAGPVPVTILRAAMILGAGSASFEIMRYLVERLPLMVTPRWVRTLVQPISIRNVLNYLVGCLEHEEVFGQTFDICGPDVLTYEGLFQIYAQEAGLGRRRIIALPMLTPRLSSYWIHLVTPVHSSIARPLAEGLSNKVICQDNRIRKIIPQELLTCRQAIWRILEKMQQRIVETSWTDAGPFAYPEWAQEGDAHYAGGTVISVAYRMRINAAPEEIWRRVERIGGERGWYFADFLWRLRGSLDKLAGGVGSSRGRRYGRHLRVGDALDMWRVLEMQDNRRLVLGGEMKAPGEAVIEFKIVPLEGDRIEVQLIGWFRPKGLWGLLYWYALMPFHSWIYKGVLRAMAEDLKKPVDTPPKLFYPGRA